MTLTATRVSTWLFSAAFLAPALASAGGEGKALANKADVLRTDLKGVSLVATHEVTDTSGKTEKQVYTVLNQVSSGNSFIVISAENAEVNGMVYLIKGNVLFAAAPNQRTFMRLGSLNLDRRIAGSLFSHWDLQGNIPAGDEYDAVIGKKEGGETQVALNGQSGSHYKKIDSSIDDKTGLFKKMTVYDDKGALKTVTYTKPKNMGGKVKRKMPTVVEMQRAEGRSDLSVPRSIFRLYEVELNPEVNYDDVLAANDANLQRLRGKYVLSGERFRSILAEASD